MHREYFADKQGKSRIFCDSKDDMHLFENKVMCASCIDKIKAVNLEDESID